MAAAGAEARGGEDWRAASLSAPPGKLPRPGKRGWDSRVGQSATRRHAASRLADTLAPKYAPRASPFLRPLTLLATRPASTPQPAAPGSRGARPVSPTALASTPFPRVEVLRVPWPDPRCPSDPRPHPAWSPSGDIRAAAAAPAWCVPCLVSLDTLQELCRKEKLTCKSIGITKRNLNNYEVEYLCDYKVVKDMEYYLVKWKGWPDSTNTWEPLQNLKCPLLLQQFSKDKHNYLSQVKKGKAITLKDNNKALRPAIAEYIVKKAKQRIALQRWQDELNRRKNHKGMIFVENTVDLEGPPSDFFYINEYKPAPGISLVNEATFGCSCTDCFFEKCCPAEAGVLLAYNKNQQIKIPPGTPIYECNSRCQCGPDCPNRIVQKGTPYSLCIFRTSNGCGWGVKTLVKIKRMSFVMEYVGEVITSEEAERRGQLYDNKGITYLFDLDYESDEFTVDAARYGNVSHFVNHSCDPNLQVFNVFIDNLDTRLPRIALFSTRTISAGEELTFDYQMKGSGDISSDSIDYSPAKKRVRTVCKCGAVTCRGYLN
ncbi:PREDICTED: histone-lysine N-methyltransferase SUV39H2 isoform X2 [Condylura cristata]|uniref:histone-lysine N-methyltransferase SUV39H2 isoform X2 n=1 Tax=Condylura cristata TaxID=143302 RepID=UPI000643DD4A|nr:PREDICTED: histone-lysine N-methyltransferase SUV39H2 isoform X2 [Condylura cristata]